MRRFIRFMIAGVLGLGPATFSAAPPAVATGAPRSPALHFPWREAGWTEREAAAHLLDRFSFGARPGDVDAVAAIGPERWFERQLSMRLAEPRLGDKLEKFSALALSTRQMAETYPDAGLAKRMAIDAGVVREEEFKQAATPEQKKALRRRIEAWFGERGFHSQREMLGQMYAQKLLRAVYSENQLGEVLTDFWFNHFNVSVTNNASRGYVLSYERDAIRPNVLAPFRQLLEATAKHPAMLAYLDNYRSVANEGTKTTAERRLDGSDSAYGGVRPGANGRRFGGAFGPPGGGAAAVRDRLARERAQAATNPNKPHGLNENYARELLELHTLGVDGGYSQSDVIAVARAFTGWTFFPPGQRGRQASDRMEKAQRLVGGLGFVEQDDFLFRADEHDAEPKTVLDRGLPAGRGVEDGTDVLDIVAGHPATAKHLARELAVRFVCDDPSPALVDRLAATFRRTGGDLTEVMRDLAASPEFWSRETRGQKIKSPFEVASSSLRALGAEVDNPLPTLDWIQRMGQALYAYQAPTGFPDRADFWVNTGALLNRMNFGLVLAAGRVAGVRFDLAALAGNREPESAAAALSTYGKVLLPERDLAATLRQLEPMASTPDIAVRVAAKSPTEETHGSSGATMEADEVSDEAFSTPAQERRSGDARSPFLRAAQFSNAYFPAARPMAAEGSRPSPVETVVGLLLGSPEFQRR